MKVNSNNKDGFEQQCLAKEESEYTEVKRTNVCGGWGGGVSVNEISAEKCSMMRGAYQEGDVIIE